MKTGMVLLATIIVACLPERFKNACKIMDVHTTAVADGTFILWYLFESASAWFKAASRYGPTTSWYFAVAAHTSPVYLRVAGKELFSPQTAAYMLALIDGAQMWVENLATRPDSERFERIRKTFTEARARLHRRMHEHGIPH